MSGNVEIIPKSAEPGVDTNMDKAKFAKWMSLPPGKIQTLIRLSLLSEYITFGKPETIQKAQYRTAVQYQNILRNLCNYNYTVPWFWEEHDLLIMLSIREEGFQSEHLFVVEFINEKNFMIKKTLIFYSDKNKKLFDNLPMGLEDFCNKVDEVRAEMAESHQMLVMFDYCKDNHNVLNLSQADVDVKSVFTDLLSKFGVVKNDSTCTVKACDPYKHYPNIIFEERHKKFHKYADELREKLADFKYWKSVNVDKETFVKNIEITYASDLDFRKIVKTFATRHLKSGVTDNV